MAYRSIDITQINAGNVNNGKTILVQGNTFVFSDSAPGNTSNITEGTNLYFTNARVYANVIALLNEKANVTDLTTSNVAEGANLYFTNTRAVQAFTPGQNVGIDANGLISVANQQFSGNTDAVPEGTANLYFTNARARAAFSSGNNVSIDANGVIQVTVYASNVIENGNTTSGNVFFTNARARAAFTAGQNIVIESNGMIIGSVQGFTGNSDIVTEGSNNLYFSNTRATTAVQDLDTIILGNIIPKSSGKTLGNATHRWKNLFLEGNTLSLGNLYLKDVNNKLIITTDPEGLTTDALDTGNVIETTNLYYTNARVYANVIGLLNAKANVTDLTTANVTELTNLYFTNSRSRSAIVAGTGISYDEANGVISSTGAASTFTGNTDGVAEGVTNLYYSNSRVKGYLAAGDNFRITGNLVIEGNLSVTGNVSQFNVQTLTVSDNLIHLNANSNTSNPDIGFAGNYFDAGLYAHTGLFRDASDSGTWKFFEGYQPEPTGQYIDTGNATYKLSNVAANYIFANIVGRINSLAGLTTDNLIEGTGNLYFTNARSRSAFIAGNNIVIEANGMIVGASQAFSGNTDVVPEGSTNLYFTNARAILAAIPATTQLIVTTPVFNYNLDQYSGDNPSIYVTAGETISFELNQSASHPFAIRVSNGGANYNTGLTHVDDDGTITTGSSAQGKYSGKLFWKIPYELAGNTYVYQCTAHSSMVGSIIIQKAVSTITTSDVVEGANLYYTNARVYANVVNLLGNYATLTDAQTLLNKTLANVHHSSNIQDSSGTSSYTIGFRGVPQNPKTSAYTLVNSDEGKHIYYTGSGATITIPVDGGTTGGTFANGAVIAIVNNGTGTVYVNSLATIKLFGSNQTGNLTLSANGIISLMKVSGNVWYASGTNTTDSDYIAEGITNLYFTNARARSAFVAGNNIVIEANGMIVGSVQTFSGNTDIVPEGTANLYFTNARARSAFTAGTGITIAANGLITGTAAFTGNTDAVLESASNLYYTNARVYANVLNITTLANKTLTNVHHSSNIQDSLGTNTYVIGYRGVPQNPKNAAYTLVNADEGKHIYYTGSSATIIVPVDGDTSGGNFANGAVVAIVNGTGNTVYVNSLATIRIFGTNQSGNVTLQSNGIVSLMKVSANVWYASGTNTTDSDYIAEGTTNLYFTNARARSAFVAGTGITLEANGMIVNTAGFSGNTNVVAEGSNNLYFTNARVYANVIGLLNAKANITDLTTSNVTEGTNLYFTNARVATYINQFVYASNVRENGDTTSGNVYFTNARARAAFTAGNGITIAANGMIVSTSTSSVSGSLVATLNESQTIQSASNSNVASYALITPVTAAANILVAIDGLIQIPTTDYTVSGSTLTFNEVLPANSNIEVKYFGTSGAIIDARGYFSRNIDQSVGYAVSNTLATAVTFPSGSSEYIVHSVYVTNIDANLSTNVAITARFDFSSTGANVIFAYQMPVDARGSLELLKKPQIMNGNDRIMLQAFDNGVAANSNVLHSIIIYETRPTTDYIGTGANVSTSTSNIYVSNSTPTILESIRIVNTSGIGNTAVTLSWTDANGVIQSYFCFGMIVPVNASIELCETPKRLPTNHMIRAIASGNNSIGVFVSGRAQL